MCALFHLTSGLLVNKFFGENIFETHRIKNIHFQQKIEFIYHNIFVFALDDTREWFRYHHLFAELRKRNIYITYARVLLAQTYYDQAISLLDRLLEIAEPNTRIRAAIEMHLLKALVLDHQKASDSAVQEIAQALSLAEEGRFMTLFALEGQPIAELIHKAVKIHDRDFQFSFAYAREVLEAFPNRTVASHPELLDELSARELDVLHALTKGMSNQEIADTLFISLNIVKTHLKRIHSKLDVKNRTEAVARGRELGLV